MGDLKRVAILGSTGSIGCQTLEVINAQPERFRVVGLAAGRNQRLLQEQVAQYRPQLAAFGTSRELLTGVTSVSLEEMAGHPDVDIVVVATSGELGLAPTLAAARAGKQIALANKEVLVMAGELVMAAARQSKAHILPVDSEHSAIWQCLHGETQPPERIILTASGGPFYGFTLEKLRTVTVEQALEHPSWRMGRKVTIDSATLMNKGLEVIEAHWLFNIPIDSIDVVIHPQSIVHSMVEFVDGSLKAQLSHPDMRLPIQYALSFPQRLANPHIKRLAWNRPRALTFEAPDMAAFPCLSLAVAAGRRGGSYPAVLSGADEAAVALFLAGRIRFTGIATLVERVLDEHRSISQPSLEEIFEAARRAGERVTTLAEVVPS